VLEPDRDPCRTLPTATTLEVPPLPRGSARDLVTSPIQLAIVIRYASHGRIG
jgi:hypothetical protein